MMFDLLHITNFDKNHTLVLGVIITVAKSQANKIGKMNSPKVEEDWTSVMELLKDEIPVDSFICNFDYESPDNAHLLFLANQPAGKKANELIGEKINLLHWVCIKKRIPDRQDGGECDVVSTVLIDVDNRTIQTMSVGVLKSIELLRRQVGTGPLGAPIPMVIMGTQTGPGSEMLTLVPQMLTASK